MGSSGSKTEKASPPSSSKVDLTEESFNRLMAEAYARGQDEAVQHCLARAAAQREEDMLTAGGTAFVMMLAISAFFSGRVARQQDAAERARARESQVEVAKEQELAVERQRVTELVALSDAQKQMLHHHEQQLEEARRRHAQLATRLHLTRQRGARLRRETAQLRRQARGLLKANGVLNQRFIAATAGAITMSLVSAAFAFAAHQPHSSGGEHSPAPTTESS